MAAVCLAGAAPAAAGVDFVVTPGFASSATVGDTGLPASLTIVNTSTQQEGSAGPVTLCAGPDTAVESTCLGDGLPAQSLLLTPACGSSAPAQSCAAGFADPGVFDLAGTATGAAATACAGVAFTISASDQATGQVTLVPASTITLAAPGGAAGSDVCEIDFTFAVLRAPSTPLAGSGTSPEDPRQTAQLAFVAGTANQSGNSGTAVGTSTVAVNQATVSATTQVTPSTVPLGGAFTDMATLAAPPGAPALTGSVTFAVYAPSDPTCAAAIPDQTSTNPLSGSGTVAVSGSFAAHGAGTYRTIATYGGDANYLATQTACSDPTAAVVVPQTTLPLTAAVAPTTVPAGTHFTDTATLGAPPQGGPPPTGTVRFDVYSPSDPACAAEVPDQTSTAELDATGASATSAGFTGNAAGAYNVIARYSGDASYAPAATGCGDPTQAVLVTGGAAAPPPAMIAVTKQAEPETAAAPGGTFTFTVRVSNPSATVPVTITRLVDDVYGDLATIAGSTCGALVGTGLAPGATSPPCSFAGAFAGAPGASQTDTVTVTAVAGAVTAVTASASATVSLTPPIAESLPQPTAAPPPPTTAAPPPPTAATPLPLPAPAAVVATPTAATPVPLPTTDQTTGGALAPRTKRRPVPAPGAINQPTTITLPSLAHRATDAGGRRDTVLATEVAAFTLLALAGDGGWALAAMAAAGLLAGQRRPPIDIRRGPPVYLRAGGGEGPGDRSSTWRWPGTGRFDRASMALPRRLATRSALLARVIDDGAYLRSMFGSLALVAPLSGVILGALAVRQTGGQALPPGTVLTIGIGALGVLDATAGFVALLTFAAGVLVNGGLDSSAAGRTLLVLGALWFVIPILAGAARPLRREPPGDRRARFDRLADIAIASLAGAWTVQRICLALPIFVTQDDVPIAAHADAAAICLLLTLVVRILAESLAARLYPRRLVAVEPQALPPPGRGQRLAAAALRTAALLFIASVLVHPSWQLWTGGLLFLVPKIFAVYDNVFPKSRSLARVLPAGLVEVVLLLFVLTAIAALLVGPDTKELIPDSFVLLAIPGATLEILRRFGPLTPMAIGWGRRAAGAAILAAGVLQIVHPFY